MIQTFTAYFQKGTPTFYIVTDIRFDTYDEMSATVKQQYGFAEKRGKISDEDWNIWRDELKADYRYCFGNVIECSENGTEKIFEKFSFLFRGLNSELQQQAKLIQFHLAQKNCKDYLSCSNFTFEFLERFTSSNGISFNRKITRKNGQRLCIDDDMSDIAYRYDSNNIRDIIFASVHFALENGYKFSQCSHCGRWFFKDGSRAGSRKKYCNRKSLFSGYEHLECEQAVRNILQELQRKKKRIYNSMIREHLSTETFVLDFLNECAEYMERIKKGATVENLSAYWDFLTNYKDGGKKVSLQK